MKVVILPASIDKIATRVDNSVSLGISTRDLAESPEEALALFSLKGKEGWLLFAQNEEDLENVKIPTEKVEFKSDKTPSQRLRSVLYIYWEQNTNKSKTFDEFYKTWIDKKVQEIKDNLE